MRLTRIAGADLRRDPAALLDAVKATGFFPGPARRAGRGRRPTPPPPRSAPPSTTGAPATPRSWSPPATSAPAARCARPSRRRRTAVAIGIYADPPGRDEIEAALAAAGLARPDREAMGEIEALARGLDPGDFAQFVEKLALYKRGDPAPLGARRPRRLRAARWREAEIDEVLDARRRRRRRRPRPRLPPPRRPLGQRDRRDHRRRPLLPHAPRRRLRRRPRGGARPRAARRSSARAGRGWPPRPAPSAGPSSRRRSA